MIRKLAAIIATAVILSCGACGGPSPQSDGAPAQVAPKGPDGTTITGHCSDTVGSDNPVDVRTVDLERQDDQLIMTWRFAQPSTSVEGFTAKVSLSPGNGDESFGQLMAELGGQNTLTLFQPPMKPLFKRMPFQGKWQDPNTFTASYPIKDLKVYGNPFKWSASITGPGRSNFEHCPHNSDAENTMLWLAYQY